MTDPNPPPPAPAAPAEVGATTLPSPRRRFLIRAGIVLFAVCLGIVGWLCYRGLHTVPERTDAEGLAPGQVEARLIEREGQPWVQISSRIDAPIAHVWKVVHDHERMTEFMPRMAKLRILEPGEEHRRVRIDFRFLFLDRHTQIDVTREVFPDRRVEEWSQFEGSLSRNHGRWLLVPIGDGATFARYEVDVDSGLPVPAWLERALMLEALPVVLTRVRERIDKLVAEEPGYFKDAK